MPGDVISAVRGGVIVLTRYFHIKFAEKSIGPGRQWERALCGAAALGRMT